MNEQTLFNIAIMLASFLGGWLLKVIWSSIKELQQTDMALMNRISEVQVTLASGYAKREEITDTVKEIFQKLSRIEDKLDRKADK